MKRTLAILLALGLSVSSLTGCGSDEKETKKEKDGKTVINFWCHENKPWIEAYEETIKRFEKEHPEYDVKLSNYPFDVYNQKIQTALTSGKGEVDIIAVWGGTAPNFIETDALAEVPEDIVKELESDYLDRTLGVFQKEGKYYGVPMEFNLEYGGMIVNKKLFEEAGLSYPQTWEELRETSKKVAKKNGEVMEMTGFDMIDADALICNYLSMILQQGGQYLEEDHSINFATPEGVKAIEEIVSMVKDGETSLESLTSGEYAFNRTYQDKGFMASVGSWGIGEGTGSYDLTYGEDFEYIPVPLYGDEVAFASETGWGIMVPENSQHKDAAWEFIEFFSQPENLVKHNIACNQLPPRKSLLDNEEYREAMPNITFLLDIMEKGQWMGPYKTSAMREIFNEMFISLCQEENPDIEKALKEVSEKITAECQLGYETK